MTCIAVNPTKRATVLALILLFAYSCLPGTAHASAPDQVFAKLKTEYLNLRNTDLEIRKRRAWETLAEKLESFARKNPRHERAGEALFSAAALHEELFKKQNGSRHAQVSSQLLAQVVSEHPRSSLADDSLLRRGDLFLDQLGDPITARESYEELLRRYPDSDSARIARRKLSQLDSASMGIDDSSPDPESATASRDLARKIVVIDPGHGGEDFGAVGKDGLLEKDVALDVALRLERMLRSIPGIEARLTRREDRFVPLAERTQLANSLGADLFVSLHANASPGGRFSGLETYYLDTGGDSAARKLAERENSSIRFEGPQGDLQYILSDLIQNAKVDDSIVLANLMQRSMLGLISAKWQNVRDLGVKRAPFYVLVGAHMPCILIELSFIDNSQDGAKLAKESYRHDLAEGIFDGIQAYWTHSGELSKVSWRP